MIDHPTYLERHLELTSSALEHLHLLLARGDYEEATSYLAETRRQADHLWALRTGQDG